MKRNEHIPEWPCPYCGREDWYAPGYNKRSTRLRPVVCGYCHVIFDSHWVDGAWMGRMYEAKWPGSLADFVAMRAETLRREYGQGA